MPRRAPRIPFCCRPSLRAAAFTVFLALSAPCWAHAQSADDTSSRRPTSGSMIFGAALEPAGDVVVLAGDGDVSAWRVEKTGRSKRLWSAPSSGRTRGVAVSLAHDVIVLGSDEGRVWSVRRTTGELVQELGTINGWVSDIALSHSEKLVAVVSLAGEAAVWTIDDATPVSLPEIPRYDRLEEALFSPDDRTLLLAGLAVRGEKTTTRSEPSQVPPTQPERFGAMTLVDLVDHTARTVELKGGGAFPVALDLSADGSKLAIGYWEGSVEVRNYPALDAPVGKFPDDSWVSEVHFVDDQSVLAATAHRIVRFDPDENELTTLLSYDGPQHTLDVFCVADNTQRLLVVDRVAREGLLYAYPSLEPLAP